MAVNLEVVEIEQHREVVKAMVRCEHEGLPVGALLHLPVTAEHVDAPGAVVGLEPQRKARGNREALPEASGTRLDAWAHLVVRMSLAAAPQLAEAHDILLAEPAQLVERRIERGRGVSLREEESVVRAVARIRRVEVHPSAEPELGHDVSSRKRAARMARAGCLEHPDDVAAQVVGDKTHLGGRPNPHLSISWHDAPI
jgi:hypothetical protein